MAPADRACLAQRRRALTKKRLFCLVMLPLRAACSGLLDEGIWDGERLDRMTPLEFSGFAERGPSIEIPGAPPGGASPEAVVAVLRMPRQFRQAPFCLVDTGSGEAAAQGVLRFVVAFGAVGAANGRALYTGEPSGASVRNATDGVDVAAALCVGRQANAAARLSYRDALVPGDPAFATAKTRLFQTLAPRAEEFRLRRIDSCRSAHW